LDESAPQRALLDRAHVIAHEVAHSWFGNLVTMAWFDDVWTKEVFANFLAAKIVTPSFPALNHELRFFLDGVPRGSTRPADLSWSLNWQKRGAGSSGSRSVSMTNAAAG
jgi:aminopeptidase N